MPGPHSDISDQYVNATLKSECCDRLVQAPFSWPLERYRWLRKTPVVSQLIDMEIREATAKKPSSMTQQSGQCGIAAMDINPSKHSAHWSTFPIITAVCHARSSVMLPLIYSIMMKILHERDLQSHLSSPFS